MKKRTIFLALFIALQLAVNAQVERILLPVEKFVEKVKSQTAPQIIDARSAEEFALNHIEGALNFSTQSPDYDKRVEALDKSRPVFTYSIGNGRSGVLAKDLVTKGFNEVYELLSGIGAWVGNGQPIFTTAKKGVSLTDYQSILTANKVVLVDIGSKYCGSCKQVKPILADLRKEHGSDLKIIELELEENPELIASLKTVTAFPYLILYKQGEIVWKKAGIKDLKTEIDGTLAKVK